MIGYHSVPIIADAYMKGIRGYDTEAALSAMVASATYAPYGNLASYMKLGYVPVDQDDEAASKTVEYAFDDLAQRQWIETKRKSGDMLTATRRELARVGDRIVPEEVKEIEQLLLNVEKALESENLNELKAANAALDQGTQALADYVMDLAMEEQLRKKGMLGDEPPQGEDGGEGGAPTPAPKPDPIAPTGTEGSIPLKGES